MNKKEKTKLAAYENLKEFRGQRVAAVVKKVSKSGMTRHIEFYADNHRRIGYDIAKLLDYPYGDYGVKVGGCGMDMIFHVLSNVNYVMATLDTGKTIQELLKTKECGERIYDNYFFDADRYIYL